MVQKDNIEEVAKLRPDYMGFIFYKKSSRYFNDVIPMLPKTIKKVGVFVDEHIDHIKMQIEKHHLNVVQLHGQEPPSLCKELKSKDIDIIKVFSIKNTFDFKPLFLYEPYVDFFLFDTKGQYPGGNGLRFNWKVLDNYPLTTPYFLSGGIGLEHIKELKTFLSTTAAKYCYAIDINSKFEVSPGKKNINNLTAFKSLL